MSTFLSKGKRELVEAVDTGFDSVAKSLEELKDRMMNLQGRMNSIEQVVRERLPEKALTERKFIEEVQGSDDIVNRIVSSIQTVQSSISLSEGNEAVRSVMESAQKTIVEKKKIERIMSILRTHRRLTSSQLSQIMGLSRTRCNEYFKEMENMSLVEPLIEGREKFYTLKGV